MEPEVHMSFPSLPSDRYITHCNSETQLDQLPLIKCPTKKTTHTYASVVQSSLPQTIIKSSQTIQSIHHELAIENFEFGQCSQNHELSNSDESSPCIQNKSNGSKKPQLNLNDCGSPKT